MSSYCTYGDYMVIFTKETQSLDLIKNPNTIVSGLQFVKNDSTLEIKPASRALDLDCNTMTFSYDDSNTVISMKLNDDGVFFTLPEPRHITAATCADTSWKAMSSDGHGFFRFLRKRKTRIPFPRSSR